MYYMTIPHTLPLITRCSAGLLWVDKLYVAYQLDDGDVHYTYVSARHINEERNSYRLAEKQRGIAVPLPADIAGAFDAAEAFMKRSGKLYWIHRHWRDAKKFTP